LTYGLERIAAFLQDVDSIYDIVWSRDPADPAKVVTYGDVRRADELQFSVYNFEAADVEKTWKHLELYEGECQALLDRYRALDDETGAARQRFPLLAAFDLCLKCSHLFNILDSRGAISVTERVGVIARVRQLAVGVAKAWVEQQHAHTLAEAEPPRKAKKAKAVEERVS
jgi:glycyl-tRNA synthetase alpha chain